MFAYLSLTEEVHQFLKQMAHLDTRQYHSLSPSTPGYGREIPGKPVKVHTFIDRTVFAELCAGTVGIFILGVLFWKLGKVFRALTRHRVLQGGKLTTARYARTWYGWVPLETHERNKEFFRKMFKSIREWLSWGSPERDYQWVWWDPGLEAMEERRAKRKRLKLLPGFLKSYEVLPAMHTAYPRSSIECHGALADRQASEPSQAIRPASEWDDIAEPLPRISFNENRFEYCSVSSISQELFTPPSWAHTRSSDDRTDGSLRLDRKRARQLLSLPININSLPYSSISRPGHFKGASWAEENTPGKQRLSRLSIVQNTFDVVETNSDARMNKGFQRTLEVPRPVFRGVNLQLTSRKYKAWSARMQVKVTGMARRHLRDSSGPPGTPFTTLLASYLSEQSACDMYPYVSKEPPRDAQLFLENIPMTSNLSSRNRKRQRRCATSVDMDTKYTMFNTAPPRLRPSQKPTLWSVRTSNKQLRDPNTPGCQSTVIQSVWRQTEEARAGTRHAALPSFMDGYMDRYMDRTFDGQQPSIPKLSDWEVRLIDQLNRKLGWVQSEMTPGMKPYHFALLANHWLNRETWLVIDPPSRVSIQHQRRWGDPRFSPSDTEHDYIPTLKYPVTTRKRALVPRIDSWRAAVNQQRRASGIRNAVRTIELYEDSAEEPPDGHIDPACWILPKPPQGFEMSTKQKNAWYEGGAGWQEKLEYWQRVRRGYRLRKAVHEGRANRNRVKEVASQVHRGCRAACLKPLPREMGQRRVAS